MEALMEVSAPEGREGGGMRGQASPWPNEAITARGLDGLAAEARRLLERIDEIRAGAAKAETEEEMKILRSLARDGGWMDLMDLPQAGLSGRNLLRGRVLQMSRDHLVEVHRNETYPNMMSVRLGPAGRKVLRRQAAKEAMAILAAPDGDTYRDVLEAREALRRVTDRIP